MKQLLGRNNITPTVMSKVNYAAPKIIDIGVLYSVSPLCSSFDETYGTEIVDEVGEVTL